MMDTSSFVKCWKTIIPGCKKTPYTALHTPQNAMVIYKNTQITLSAGSLLSNLTIITTRIMNKYCITLKGCITNLNQLFNMSTHYSTLGHRRASAQNAIFVHYLIPSKSSLAAPPGMVSSQRSSAPCKTNHHHY